MDFQEIKTLIVEQKEEFLAKDLGLERNRLADIAKCFDSELAVIISGLRRSGKSVLLRQIAKKYLDDQNFYYINFEDERLVAFKAEDFNKLLEIFIELFGEQKYFIIDEIQNINGWEIFTRRLIDYGYKLFITGSNAQLLSKELGTKLTGRYVEINLFPFSFDEYLRYKEIDFDKSKSVLTTKETARLKAMYNLYIEEGGIPLNLKIKDIDFNLTLYNNILFRDVIARYKIESQHALKELGNLLASNISNRLSYNQLLKHLNIKSINTIKNFVSYFEQAWIFMTITIFDASIKRQQIAPKKAYCIDPGIVRSVGFSINDRQGQFLENMVFLHLLRQYKEIFYYQTKKNKEVDFFIPKHKLLFQVSYSLEDDDTRKRELDALEQAMDELNINQATIITYDREEILKKEDKEIRIIPFYKF